METVFDETWFHAPLAAIGDRALLDEAESRHLRKVLRISQERPIVISNGIGRAFLCSTRDAGPKVEAEAVEILVDHPIPPRMHVVLSLLKGRDTEEPVEGLCQLDVAAIHLVTTDHTQEFKGQDHGRLVQRLEQKSLAGLKQAKKTWLTAIHAPLPLQEWAKRNPGNLILVHPGLDTLEGLGEGILRILVGPEGGFSRRELEWLKDDLDCRTLSLGGTRIRGTHAPLLACGKLMGLGLL